MCVCVCVCECVCSAKDNVLSRDFYERIKQFAVQNFYWIKILVDQYYKIGASISSQIAVNYEMLIRIFHSNLNISNDIIE